MKLSHASILTRILSTLLVLSLLLVPAAAAGSDSAASEASANSAASGAFSQEGTDTAPLTEDPASVLGTAPESGDQIHFIKLDTDITSDSFLIESGGVTMLVDTSNPDPTTEGTYAVPINTENVKAVVDYLTALGIHHLDYLVMTHNHSDHIGGVSTLCNLNFIDEDTIVYSRTGKATSEDVEEADWGNHYYYQLAVTSLRKVGAEFHSLMDENTTELTVKVGNFDVEFMNLDLDHDGQVDFDSENENNNSLVLKVTKGDMDTLLTADIETEQEEALVEAYDLSGIEVLKAPHHGSTTSSCYEFLKELQPETVIVTSFRYRQGGAHMYTQNILGADIYVTKEATAGAIVETVYDDHYDIDNGVIFTEDGMDGWLSWFDYYMYVEDGEPVADGWKKISGDWYYFDEDGIMQTGPITVDGKDYYLDTTGKVVTGFIEVNGRIRFYAPWNGAATSTPAQQVPPPPRNSTPPSDSTAPASTTPPAGSPPPANSAAPANS